MQWTARQPGFMPRSAILVEGHSAVSYSGTKYNLPIFAMHAATGNPEDEALVGSGTQLVRNSSQVIHRKPRRIVCAAYRHRKFPNRILAGVRHGDAVMLGQMHPMENPGDFEAGFLCSRSVFLTRKEAAMVAFEAGQIADVNNLCLMDTEIW